MNLEKISLFVSLVFQLLGAAFMISRLPQQAIDCQLASIYWILNYWMHRKQ